MQAPEAVEQFATLWAALQLSLAVSILERWSHNPEAYRATNQVRSSAG